MEIEFGYQMFEPKEKYHLDHLKMASSLLGSWKTPGRHKVKLYHPFTFDLPINRKLPKMNIFTIPIKSLGRAELGLLSEVHGENDTVSVLLKASEEISNEDGIYGFAHYVQDSVKGKESRKNKRADWKNFGLEASSGTMKELSKVSNILRPFKKHYFLAKQNCEYNLDWKNILTDQEHYHVFVSNFIGRKEEKVTDFIVLYLMESILRNKQYLNNPVLIVIPEISYLCPFRPEGHKEFLSNLIQKNLKTMRSEGRGISTILDTQVFGNVSEEVRGSSTIQFFGELGDIKDVENICKALGYGKNIKEQLSKAEIPRTYLIRGVEDGSADDGGYLFFYPKAMHCEPEYNFEEMYKEHNKKEPETYPLVSYREMYDKMKKMFSDEEKKIKDKVNRKEKEQEELELKKEKEKEEKKQEGEKVQETKEKVKEIEDKSKETLMRLCYEMFNDENLDKKDKSFRNIAIKLGIKSHKTVGKYIEKYSEIIKQRESQDFEEIGLKELDKKNEEQEQ
jgi:rRNA processing protein Gar1